MQKIVLFDENLERSESGPIRYGESGYAFLNRMGKDSSDERRRRANELFAKYPDSLKPNMLAQLTAPRPTAFTEFMFELLVHEYLIDNGVKIEEIEPKQPNGHAPDFLCSQHGSRFYAEVVTIHDIPPHKHNLDHLKTDLTYLSSSKWKAGLLVQQYSDDITLDVFKVRKELGIKMHENRKLQYFEHEINQPGWALKFRLERVPEKLDYFLAAVGFGVMRVKTRERLIEKVREKASKYGRLPYPLIIFVNIVSDGFSRLNEGYDAMYGRDVYTFSSIGEFDSGKLIKLPDGICHSSSNTELLDSVLFFDAAYGAGLSIPPHVRIVNPCCANPLKDIFDSTPTVTVDSNTDTIFAVNPCDRLASSEHTWFQDLLQNKPS